MGLILGIRPIYCATTKEGGERCPRLLGEYDFDRDVWIVRRDGDEWDMRHAERLRCGRCKREYSRAEVRALVMAQAPNLEDIAGEWAA